MKLIRRAACMLICAVILIACDVSSAPAQTPNSNTAAPAETAYPAPAGTAYPAPTAPTTNTAYPIPTITS